MRGAEGVPFFLGRSTARDVGAEEEGEHLPPPPPAREVKRAEALSFVPYVTDEVHLQRGLTLLRGSKAVVAAAAAEATATTGPSDLVPGRYEGGFKLWESSVDLIEAVRVEMQDGHLTFRGKDVLELGCGHGLPGIFACLKGAAAVHFQDFNDAVLINLTIPNLDANLAAAAAEVKARTEAAAAAAAAAATIAAKEHGSSHPHPHLHPHHHHLQDSPPVTPKSPLPHLKTRFFAGDWADMPRVLPCLSTSSSSGTHLSSRLGLVDGSSSPSPSSSSSFSTPSVVNARSREDHASASASAPASAGAGAGAAAPAAAPPTSSSALSRLSADGVMLRVRATTSSTTSTTFETVREGGPAGSGVRPGVTVYHRPLEGGSPPFSPRSTDEGMFDRSWRTGGEVGGGGGGNEGRRGGDGRGSPKHGSPKISSPKIGSPKFCSSGGSSSNSSSSSSRRNPGYDVILTAETVYSITSMRKLLTLVKQCLRRPYGVLYLAGKKHYFGVGGGTRQFHDLVEEDGCLHSRLLATVADGVSNVREIWKFYYKPNM